MFGGCPKSEEVEKSNHQVIHDLPTEEKGPGPLEVEVPQGCWISVGHNELKRREETRRRRSETRMRDETRRDEEEKKRKQERRDEKRRGGGDAKEGGETRRDEKMARKGADERGSSAQLRIYTGWRKSRQHPKVFPGGPPP